MRSKVIIALDFQTMEETMAFVSLVSPKLCRLKVGKALFTRFGPSLVKKLIDLHFDVFLDLKFHDIPTTVSEACKSALDLGVWMLNVHALGGSEMLQAANRARSGYDAKLVAVTILTSLNQHSINAIGLSGNIEENVLRLATLTKEAGLNGVVCSSEEAPLLKSNLGQAFELVTPGIRLEGDAKDCQERVMTPVSAIQAGSDYLVIGRSITKAPKPNEVLETILQNIEDTH